MDSWYNFPFHGAWIVALVFLVVWLLVLGWRAEHEALKSRRSFNGHMEGFMRAWEEYDAMQKSSVQVAFVVDSAFDWCTFPKCLAEVALDGTLRIYTLEEPDDYGRGYVCHKTTVRLLKPREWAQFKSSGPAADAAVADARGQFGASR